MDRILDQIVGKTVDLLGSDATKKFLVQTMAADFPEEFFAPAPIEFHAPPPDEAALERAVAVLRSARRPLLIAGGGVLYGLAADALRAFAETHRVPVAETQAGKGALAYDDRELSRIDLSRGTGDLPGRGAGRQ